MAKSFKNLREKMSPEARARATAGAREVIAEVTLRQLRERLSDLSQEDLARLLEVTQPYVSKLERQGDMLISKLYEYVEALGGHVEIHAKFRDEDVVINQFSELAQKLRLQVKGHG